MIQTLQDTIFTAILCIALAIMAGYLLSHVEDITKPIENRLVNAASVK